MGRLTALTQIRETRTLTKNQVSMQGNPAPHPTGLKQTLTQLRAKPEPAEINKNRMDFYYR